MIDRYPNDTKYYAMSLVMLLKPIRSSFELYGKKTSERLICEAARMRVCIAEAKNTVEVYDKSSMIWSAKIVAKDCSS